MDTKETGQAPDPAEVAKILGKVAEHSSNVLADFVTRHANGKGLAVTDEFGIARAFMDMWAKLLANPMALAQAQMNMYFDYLAAVAVVVAQAHRPDARAGRRAGAGRQSLQGRGLAEQLRLRLHQAELPHRRAPHPRRRVGDRRAARRVEEEGRLLHSPVRRRAVAVELRAHQPAGAARDDEVGRHQPGEGPEEPARGPRRGRRAAAHQDDRREGVPDRPQRRHHAGQGRVPERPDAAHPVQPVDRDGVQAAAPDHPALDQQVLHPRSAREELVHPLGGPAGPHRVRGVVGESRRAARQQELRGLHDRGPARRAGRDRAGDRASAGSTRSATASAARCSARRSATWRPRATTA